MDYSIVRAKTLHASLIWQFDYDQLAFACQPSGSSFIYFFLPGDPHCQVCACQPWVRPVCFSFKSKMCIANLTDDLSLVGPASYLAPLGSKSIARLSCCAGTTGAEGPNRGGTQDVRDESAGHVLAGSLCSKSVSLPHTAQIEFALTTCLKHNPIWRAFAQACVAKEFHFFFSVKLQSPALVIFLVDFSKV